MHTVVNHLPIQLGADWAEISAKFEAFSVGVRRDYPAMRVAVLTRMGDSEAVFVGVYDDETTMKHVSSSVAAPWFAENMRQYLAGPANRSVGPVIGGFVR
jgi:hypothetical protein